MDGAVEKKRSHWWLWFALGGILILIAIFVVIAIKKGMDRVYTNDAFIEGFRIDLSPDILGRIIELKVDEGECVKEGQVVAILQQDIYTSQKVEAQAALKSAIKQVAVQKAHLEKVRNDYIRATQGIEDQIISPQMFDHQQKDYEMAEAKYLQAIADVDLAESKVKVIDTYLNHTFICAPFDGMIAKRWVFTGDVVRPSQAIFTVYEEGNVWVQANLSEKKIEKVKLGDRVDISVDAYPDKTFHGEVFTIKGAAASQFSVIPQNNATGNYTKVAQRIPIKITLDVPKGEQLYLFPGMNAEVDIKVKTK
ncbi:MAG: HlyD family secretion protein [Chlamydiia bacterium]|nr:HlyD family secretion protein [Chlamydiia bacterium]